MLNSLARVRSAEISATHHMAPETIAVRERTICVDLFVVAVVVPAVIAQRIAVVRHSGFDSLADLSASTTRYFVTFS